MGADAEVYKKQAAERAAELVESGMVVGLGHGSTALVAVRRIGDLMHEGRIKDIVGVPCSKFIEAEAGRLGIALTNLEVHPDVDLTIDGADEVAPNFDLIKGGGGALLREKIVAQASKREIIVVDESKLSPKLGTRFAVPVEVVPFGWSLEMKFLTALGAEVELRVGSGGRPFETDQGNLLLDADFGPIGNAAALAVELDARAGIVGHGLFLGLATDVIVAGPQGLRHLKAGG
ncbi:MAG: ribose 5-phosphate isomerase [Gemmatimonas sp. SM23_52]|nr:MAG: ribose 5-phosphate isomerase [Gemmatimonas sp. SM23_52]